MTKRLEYILSAVLLLLCTAAVAFVVAVQHRDTEGEVCGGLDITIAESWHFVTPEDVRGYICNDYGECIGRRMDSLDLDRIENLLDGKSAVLKSQVWCTPDNTMHINITQRRPLARLQKGSAGCYVDKTGCFFPLNKNFNAKVPVIEGDIPLDIKPGFKGQALSESEQQWTEDVIEMVSVMVKSELWKTGISKICVEGDDIVMTPVDGREKFVFGAPSGAAGKFRKMEKYYTHIAPSQEKGYYGRVNVKYKGQIICTQ